MSVLKGNPRDRYRSLRVSEIVSETDDACSILFDVPDELADAYRYVAGQFVTLVLDIDEDEVFRSYSMSSSPAIDDGLKITVKRVDGGVVSNWLHDKVAEGDTIDVGPPSGAFVLTDSTDDIVAFAGGSGITPIFSIVATALRTTDRRIRLLFANQSRSAAIFDADLAALAAAHPGRLVVEHHLDSSAGYLTSADVQSFLGAASESTNGVEVYICGPTGLMDVVEAAVVEAGIGVGQIHLERFTPIVSEGVAAVEAGLAAHAPSDVEVEITMGRRTAKVAQMGEATLLQSARWCGLPARSSCETGHCAACMALVVEGDVKMYANDALTPAELEEGWVLTCQAVPVSNYVHVVYDP